MVSISTEKMLLHVAHSPDFCKWATPMEITVKFNSDVISEPVQFDWFGVCRVCGLSELQEIGHKMSEEPVNIKQTSTLCESVLACRFFLLSPPSFAQPIIIFTTMPDLPSVILLFIPMVTWPLAEITSFAYYFTTDLMKEKHSYAQTCMGSSVSFQVGAFSVDFVAAFIITSMYSAFSLCVWRFHR